MIQAFLRKATQTLMAPPHQDPQARTLRVWVLKLKIRPVRDLDMEQGIRRPLLRSRRAQVIQARATRMENHQDHRALLKKRLMRPPRKRSTIVMDYKGQEYQSHLAPVRKEHRNAIKDGEIIRNSCVFKNPANFHQMQQQLTCTQWKPHNSSQGDKIYCRQFPPVVSILRTTPNLIRRLQLSRTNR